MEIKELRQQLGLTQQEFATRLGISISAVSRWESGQRKPGRLASREIERLLEKVGVNMAATKHE